PQRTRPRSCSPRQLLMSLLNQQRTQRQSRRARSRSAQAAKRAAQTENAATKQRLSPLLLCPRSPANTRKQAPKSRTKICSLLRLRMKKPTWRNSCRAKSSNGRHARPKPALWLVKVNRRKTTRQQKNAATVAPPILRVPPTLLILSMHRRIKQSGAQSSTRQNRRVTLVSARTRRFSIPSAFRPVALNWIIEYNGGQFTRALERRKNRISPLKMPEALISRSRSRLK